MKPYYQDDWVTIYHGDCVERMDFIHDIDLVITDPPYGMNFQSNYRFLKYDKITNDFELPVEIIKQAIGMAKNAAYVFCRWDNLKDMPKPKSVLAWVKNNWSMGDLEHEHGRQWEAICFYPGPNHQFKERIPDVIHADRTGNKLHPTQKPENLLKKLILSNVGKVVFDPFCGSGSTLRAAKDLGRYSIGCEIEEKYCEIAARRMSQEVLI